MLQRRFGPEGALFNAAGSIEIAVSFALSVTVTLLIRFTHADQAVVVATIVILPVGLAFIVLGFLRVFQGERIRKLTVDERPPYPDNTWLIRMCKGHPVLVGTSMGVLMTAVLIGFLALLYRSPYGNLLVLGAAAAVLMPVVLSIAMVQSNRAQADR